VPQRSQHHGNDTRVAVVDPRLPAVPSSATVVPPLGLLSLVWGSVCPLIVLSPIVSSASIVADRFLSICCRKEPFHGVERAGNQFCEANVVHYLVDEGCWPFEMFALAKLCLNQHRVENRAFASKDCPRNPAAEVGRERVPDDVDFLLIQCFTDLKETLVVVTLISKECPDESAEGVYAQAQFKVVIWQWAWWSLSAALDFIKLHGMGSRTSCLLVVLDSFDLMCCFGVARED
jgi:hypothetical protein